MKIKKQDFTYKNIVAFENIVSFRLKEEDENKINVIVNKNQDVYFNNSHFIRCAVLKLLREYDNKGKLIDKIKLKEKRKLK